MSATQPVWSPRLGKGAKQSRKLSDAQARTIRLSMETSADLAKRYPVSVDAIRKLRAGDSYGALAIDERAAARRRAQALGETPPFPTDTLMVGDLFNRVAGLREQDRQEQLDATYECSHGRLPMDRVVSCDCWVL